MSLWSAPQEVLFQKMTPLNCFHVFNALGWIFKTAEVIMGVLQNKGDLSNEQMLYILMQKLSQSSKMLEFGTLLEHSSRII